MLSQDMEIQMGNLLQHNAYFNGSVVCCFYILKDIRNSGEIMEDFNEYTNIASLQREKRVREANIELASKEIKAINRAIEKKERENGQDNS